VGRESSKRKRSGKFMDKFNRKHDANNHVNLFAQIILKWVSAGMKGVFKISVLWDVLPVYFRR
jgi:hypothetical protein